MCSRRGKEQKEGLGRGEKAARTGGRPTSPEPQAGDNDGTMTGPAAGIMHPPREEAMREPP